MPVTGEEREFVAYVVDLMQTVGPVHAKRMFGGHGIFLEGLMFGLVSDSTLYLKADKASENDFREKGLEAFSYDNRGKEFRMSYFQAPEEALEDSDVMNEWANRAYSAAIRAASAKRRKQ